MESTTSLDKPTTLDVNNGLVEEKPDSTAPTQVAIENDEEDEKDIDSLIEELQSVDGFADLKLLESNHTGGRHPVSDELLHTDSNTGLSTNEALLRRKKFGLNEMKEGKENLIFKFLWFFVGPVQFVMEVCVAHSFS